MNSRQVPQRLDSLSSGIVADARRAVHLPVRTRLRMLLSANPDQKVTARSLKMVSGPDLQAVHEIAFRMTFQDFTACRSGDARPAHTEDVTHSTS